MRRHLLCFVHIALLSGAAAAAQPYQRFHISDAESDRVTSEAYRTCMDASGGVTANMRDCAYAESQRLDGRLNAAYHAALERLPDNAARAQLRALERRWLATRYRQCDRDALRVGGTLGLVAGDGCSLGEDVRRIVWLERYGRRH